MPLDEIRYNAAAAVVSLANRTESAGKKDADQAKGKGWVPMPGSPDLCIKPDKLREAVAYYEIAESIDRAAAGWGYPRAMLLEAMGAWDEAIAAYATQAGSAYEEPGKMGIARCTKMRRNTPGVTAAPDRAPTPPPAQVIADDEDGRREQATETAQAFVNQLLDRNYRAARAMLHPAGSQLTDDDLREGFEAMFEGEDFPETATVFDVKTDLPGLEPGDLAWVYVTIDSENQEAVSMHVSRHDGRPVVRNIEWGRP